MLTVRIERHRPVRLSGHGRETGQQGRPFAPVFFMFQNGDAFDPREFGCRSIGRPVVDDPDGPSQRKGPPDHGDDAPDVVVDRNQDRKAAGRYPA